MLNLTESRKVLFFYVFTFGCLIKNLTKKPYPKSTKMMKTPTMNADVP